MSVVPVPGTLPWVAFLDLAFERRSAATVLARNHHRGPLLVQKALYPEGEECCHVAVLHPPGGIVAGDQLAISGSLGRGSRAVLTTPGATKWYRSEGAGARQQIRFSLQEDAVLEWLPRENIYFDGSRVASGLDISLAAGAIYFGWDIVAFGRRASGESWRHGDFDLRVVVRQGGRMLWSELGCVRADDGFAHSVTGLAGLTVCGTFVVAGVSVDARSVAQCRAVTPSRADARLGITTLPGMVIARYLGHSTEEAFEWFTALWSLLRPVLSGRKACPPRVWAC